MPGMPRFCGWLSGKAPRAISVVTTGAPVSAASSASSSVASRLEHAAADVEDRPAGAGDQRAPPRAPACRAAGWSACSRAGPAAAARRSRCAPAGRPWGCRPAPGPGGRSRPGGTPRRSAAGSPSASVTRKLCLVTGIVMPRMSASWKASVPIERLGTCPVIATIGTESMCASASGVTRLVAPGPGGGHADADLAGGLRVPGGRVPGALLVADQDVAHLRVEQRVVGRQDRTARDAEDHLDADGLERADEALRAGDARWPARRPRPGGHGRLDAGQRGGGLAGRRLAVGRVEGGCLGRGGGHRGVLLGRAGRIWELGNKKPLVPQARRGQRVGREDRRARRLRGAWQARGTCTLCALRGAASTRPSHDVDIVSTRCGMRIPSSRPASNASIAAGSSSAGIGRPSR